MITLNTAKELKELCFMQNTNLCYVVNDGVCLTTMNNDVIFKIAKNVYAIPDFKDFLKLFYHIQIPYNSFEFDKLGVYYILGTAEEPRKKMFVEYVTDFNIAEAAAKLWIKLKKEKIL